MLALILGFAGENHGPGALRNGNVRQFAVSPSILTV
jgi:hypothetical protein